MRTTLPRLPQKLLALCALTLLLSGCSDFPKDPENTLHHVENGTLVVGYSVNPPWVVETGQAPTGIEPALVQAFASSLHARVRWQRGPEHTLFEALKKQRLHLVVAGLVSENPWKEEVGFTRPFAERHGQQHVMAVRQGENAFLTRLERFLYQHKPATAQ